MSVTEYDKYNTLAESVNGPIKPPKTDSTKTPKVDNKYEALRQSGVETSVIGRNTSDVTSLDKGAVAGENTSETRAYKQGALDQYMRGGLKGAGLIGTTVASTFTSLPYGILKASYQGAFDDTKTAGQSFSSVYDNEASQFLDDFNKNMEQWFPNHYSEKEQKAGAFDAENILSANFWGDKVLKNAGFTVGAILGGKGVAKGMQWLGKMAMGGKYAQEMASMNALISTGMKPAEAMRKVAGGIRALDAATSLGASTIAAAGEGSMEAKQVKDELKDNLIAEYKLKNSVDTVPFDELDRIERLSSSAGNTTFAANMAILTASDYFQFGKLFNKGFKQEATRVGKMVATDGVYAAVKPSFKSRVASMLGSGLANSLSESAEEGSQTFTQAASKDYYTRQFDKNGLATKDDMMQSMLTGLSETFESKEGLEGMLLGAVTGGGSHIAINGPAWLKSKFGNAKPSEYDNTVKAASTINAANKRLQPFMDSIVRGDSITKDKEAILKSNNPSKFLFGNLAHDEFKNIIQPYLETDKFDILEDRLNGQYQRDDISDWGTDTRKTAKEYTANLLTEAKRLRDSWDTVNTRFPNADYNAKVALWDSMTNIENRDNRAKELEAKIAQQTGVHYSVVTAAGKDFMTEVSNAIDNGAVRADLNDAKDLERLVNQKKDLVAIYKKLLTPEEQAKVANHVKKVVAENSTSTTAESAENTEPIIEPTSVDAKGQPEYKADEDVVEAPEVTQTPEEGNPITEPEIVTPEASNEPVSDARDIEKEASDLVDTLKPSIDSGENTLDDVFKWLDEQEGDEEDAKLVARVKEMLTTKPAETATPETTSDTPSTEPVSTIEEDAQDLYKQLKASIDSGEQTIKDVVAWLDENIADSEGEDKAIGERVRELLTTPTPEAPSVSDMSDAQIDEVNDKVEELVDADDEGPTISENDEVHSDYSEMDKMSDTAFRTTANHEEAMAEGLWSVVRYQNFINNPNTNLQGLKLKVITKSDPLYERLLNKKQKTFEDNRRAEGKEINGILAVVVDANDNIIVTDTSGELVTSYSTKDYPADFLMSANIDNTLEGPLVTTLVSNANKKDSNFNAVSYQHFGRVNGFGEKITEKEALDPTTPVGALWKQHVDKLANDRAAMLKGDIKYLSITGSSSGIFQNTNQANELGETLGVDVNSPSLSFIVPKIEDITTPGLTTLGTSNGLTKEQTVKVGKPYLIYNGKLFPLKTRRLNGSEVDNIAKMLELAIANPSRTKYFMSKVKELVYLNKATIDSIMNGELAGDDLREYLSTKYRQIDAKALESNPTDSYEISSVTDKGVNTKKAKTSYRDFVLVGEGRALSINYSPHPTTVKDKPNYLNGYITYNAIEELPATKPVEKAESTTVEQIANASGKALTKAEKAAKLAKLRAKADSEEDNSSLKRKISLQDSSKKEDIAAAQSWFNKAFGEGFDVVDSLINGNAFGEYTAAATRLFSGAEEGTVYHEAFHKVTQEYLTAKQVASLYDAVRKNINSKYSDLEAEEWLAEEFRKYVLGGQKAIKNMPLTNNIFKRLYNWIKSLVTGTTTPEQVFKRLAGKGYTGAKKFNNQQFTKLERAIPGLTHQQTKNIIDSVNGHFFRRLFAAGLTPDEILGNKGKDIVNKIYDRVFKSLSTDYAREFEYFTEDLHSEEEWEAIDQHYRLMLELDENDMPTTLSPVVIQAHKDYLSSIGIDIAANIGLDESDKAEDANTDADDRSRDTAYDKNANEESSIHSAPNSIKLLVMSLAEVDDNGEAVSNNIGGPKLNDYLHSMKLLYANMAGLSSFEDMYNKLTEISVRFPVFRQLMSRLGEPGSNKTLEQFLLEQDFRQAFSKFESKGTITLINPDTGAIYQVDANANKLKDRIKENWIGNLRGLANDPTSYITKNDEGVITIKESFFTDARAKKFVGNSKALLSALGIEFTDLSQEQVQAIPDIKDITNTIFKYVAKAVEQDKVPINDLFSKDADVRGQVSKLIDVEAPLSKEVVELSYISAEGKRIYAVSLNHYYSLTVNNINNAATRDELFSAYPHLDNPYTKNSVWLKNLFDKSGKKIPGQRLYVNTVSGLKIQNQADSGVGATKMEPSDKIVQEINDLLGHGSVSLIRAADKSSEFALGITNYEDGEHLAIPLELIEKEGLANSKVHEIFMGYFTDELERIRAFRSDKKVGANFAIYGQPLKNKDGSIIKGSEPANNFSLFADILSPKTLSTLEAYKTTDDEIDALLEAKIGKEITDYLESYAKDVTNYINERKVGLKDSKGFTGINPEFTEKGLEPAIQTFVANHLVNMIEQSKLLVGDSAFYKDKIKRISAGTGTKKFAANSKLVNDWLNNFYKTKGRVDGKVANGRVKTVIFDDVKAALSNIEEYIDALEKSGMSKDEARKVLEAYAKWDEKENKWIPTMDEGDAQGWITLDEYREFFIRVGGAYWTEEHEKQYQWEIHQEAREKGEFKDWMNISLDYLNSPNPGFYFMPIKAQHFGPQVADNIYAPAFHKYSLAPLYHSLVKGRNMEKMLDSMRKNQVGYALFGSGSKVGTPVNLEGKLPSFYDEQGNISGIYGQVDFDEDGKNGLDQRIPTPIQEIYYENLGIQLDIAPKVKEKIIFGSQTRKLVFSNLFGENTKPEFQKLASEYNELVDKLVQYEFKKLTKRLGISVGANGELGFKGDYKKLVSQLRESLEDKDTADNIIDSLQTNDDGSLKYPIDSMVNRPKIESMLFSIVNSNVIKQKMNGNSLVQLASSGFEDAGNRKTGTSNYLKFYSQEGQITSKDRVIFGHPTIGKTFLKTKGNDKFISLDDDYAQDIKDFIAKNKKADEDKYQYQERKPKEFIDFTLELFDKAKALAEKEGKQIFTSNNILLDKRGKDFDKVVDLDREEFFKRIGERNTTYDVKAWKDQIDALISRVDSSKVIKTKGYLSDLLSGGGKTTAMEVEIAMNKNFMPLVEKYGSIELVNKAISEGKISSRQLQMIGYRIPTQGLNSMDVMTIKRFLPSEAGIALILPTGVVAKSGGDYDIDKLNIFMPHMDSKEGSKEAMQDRIIDIMSEVLTHPDNFIDLTTPNTTDTLTDLVGRIRKARGESPKIEKASMTREFRFDFIMDQFTYFLGGKAALGIAATHNTHHILSQIAKVKLNASIPFKHNTSNDQVDLGGTTTQGGQKISDLISQFINAYVDVAKDPFYKDLNAGTEVTSVWMYLIRAGVDINTIGYFMTQPIILDYVAARKLNKSLVNSKNKQAEYKADLSEEGIQKIKNKMAMSTDDSYIQRMQLLVENGSVYNDMLAKHGTKDGKFMPVSFSGEDANEKLLAMISGKLTDRNAQTYLLEQFVTIEKQAGELTTLMQDTNNDTTRLQNYGSIFKRGLVSDKVRESEIIPAGTSENIKKNTIVGSFDLSNKISQMYSELTLYTSKPSIKLAIDNLLTGIDSKLDFAREYTRIQNDFIGYITQKFGKTIEGESLASKMSLLSGDNSLAKQLVNLRKQGLEDLTNNALFNELVAQINGDTKQIDTVKLYSRRMGAFESNVFTESFRELLESNDPTISKFGRDLAYVTILQSGLQNSPVTFTELIPFEFYGEIVSGAIKSIDKLDIDDFTKAYYHNQSNGSYKIQDFGITDSPKNTKIQETLPEQNDPVLDVFDNPVIANTTSDGYLTPEQQEQFDKNNRPFEGARELENRPVEIDKDVVDTRTGEVLFSKTKPGSMQNAIREANTISDMNEEDGEVNKQCNI